MQAPVNLATREDCAEIKDTSKYIHRPNGKLLVVSIKGKTYIMVMCVYNANVIMT